MPDHQAHDPETKSTLPLTLITGFLGSGKTTLLDALLKELNGRRWAVIVNEVAPLGIDPDLLGMNPEALVTLPNGCLCCTFQGDLVPAVRQLRQADPKLEGILVETSGLAEPDPIVTACFMDPYLAANVSLDGVITVVDGVRGPHLLEDQDLSALMHHQTAIADVVVVSRADQAKPVDLSMMISWARHQAPLARVISATMGRVPSEYLIGLHAHDLRADLPELADHVHAHDIGHETMVFDRPFDARTLDRMLCDLLREHGDDLLRCKGIVEVDEDPNRWIFQGAGPLFATSSGESWGSTNPRISRLVFIGRNLERMHLRERVQSCVIV